MGNRRILLVEGKDDEHVLKHICGTHNIPHLDEIVPHDSVEQLLESVPVRLKASEEGDVVGVVIDADINVSSRWTSIRDRVRRTGYENVPADPNSDGTILNPPDTTVLPRLGFWIMPNNCEAGILEDFLRFLVPHPDRLFDHVNKCVADIPDRRFNSLDEPKAIIHTWLAWQKEPGRPFGTAITAGFLDPNVDEANVLASWLKRLFFP